MASPAVRRSPATRARRGFSLIELLIVVVIIGILAAIALPSFAGTKGKANAAKMKSDLRSLATAEEGYFYEKSTYTGTLANLNGYTPSPGVTITVTASVTGWSATATNPAASPQNCYLFYGNATPPVAGMSEGVVHCP